MWASLVAQTGKNLPVNVGSVPGSRKSPGEGRGNPLQYSCLANSMDSGAWQAAVLGIAKSQTELSDLTLSLAIVVTIQLFATPWTM